ncbi:hepatic and glial cell adhesion molecule-like [Chiloscyllium punctatum]|uniref:hepatic and glial cell adhesion molecule-like n=1 Tax=Chiloscyllium punctatum TaxID=137246 RepID=UPI003B63CAEB
MDPRSAPVLLLLLLGFLRGIAAGAGGGDVLAAIGSSVLLDPGHGANLSHSQVEWTFTGSDGKLVTILDYIPNFPIQKPNEAFKSRLHFNASNGSVTLTNLKPSDQGVYTITVGSNWKRSMDLKLIEPLREPSIVNNCTCLDTAIELTCRVAGGQETSTHWWKDNRMLTSGQYYQLMQNNSTLIISEAKMSDCGTYTCTVENPVSQKNASYSLKLHGLTGLHHSNLAFSVAALVTAGVTLITAVASCLEKKSSMNKDITKWRQFIREKMQHLLKAAPVLSFIFFSVACACWMLNEVCLDKSHTLTSVAPIITNSIPFVDVTGQAAGHLGITGILFAFLILHLAVILSICRFIRDKRILSKIIANKVCQGILNVSTVCGPSILIGEIMKQADSDCGSTTILQSTILPTVVMTLINLVVVVTFLPLTISSEWVKQLTGTPASSGFGDSDQHQYTKVKETPSSPGAQPSPNE